MKKLLILILLAALLLTGCEDKDKPSNTTSEPTDRAEEVTQETTEPPEPWIDAVGMPWDAEGVLLEIPLTVPDGMHYTSTVAFGDHLLLWSVDDHLENTRDLELCVISLHDGSVIAQRDIAFSVTVIPQVLGDSLYLCDDSTGTIQELDKNLLTKNTWQTEPMEGNWYMGAGEKLYIYNWDDSAYVRDLKTGETAHLLEGDPAVQYLSAYGDSAVIEYYRMDTGARTYAVLDLTTGEIWYPPVKRDYDQITFSDGNWLLCEYDQSHEYTLCLEEGALLSLEPSMNSYKFLDGSRLLAVDEEDSTMALYDLEGKLISQCRTSEVPYSNTCETVIWSDEYNGYFCTVGSYGSNQRLLFWDISKGDEGENLTLTPVPEPSEMEAMVTQRAQELGEKYGLVILVGDQCDTVFDEFSASITEDWEEVNDALDVLDNAMSVYPEGFFRQLRWGTIHSIQIHLVTDLMADGSGRHGDGYVAFAQEKWDHYLVVMDIEDTYEETYYHEMSHIIDTYLEWDSWQREDALFSEETWNSFNPSWFTGYTYDYSWEHELRDYESFVDGYSTINPTEDRARVMEYAMADYGEWTFEEADILMAKLAYYSRCIRDAFDTKSWPDMLPWEQYLRD